MYIMHKNNKRIKILLTKITEKYTISLTDKLID